MKLIIPKSFEDACDVAHCAAEDTLLVVPYMWYAELEQPACDLQYTAYVHFTLQTFNCCFARKHVAIAMYDGDQHFHISPPLLAQFTSTVHTMLSGYVDPLPRYARDPAEIPQGLPTGYATPWNDRRAAWCAPCNVTHHTVHPKEHRVFSEGEVLKCLGYDSTPHTLCIDSAVSKDCFAWLKYMCKLFNDNTWGDQDWSSSYDPKTRKWLGGECTDVHEKTFDMREYKPEHFDHKAHADVTRIEYPATDTKFQKEVIKLC